jgi:DNA polymerase (family 10)
MKNRIKLTGPTIESRQQLDNILHHIRRLTIERNQVISDGRQNMIVRLPNGVQLDVFLARPREQDLLETRPGNFGSLLLCRTGSREHNIFLIEEAKKHGLTWQPYEGVKDATGRIIASEEEEHIFQALGLEFVPPAFREV